MNTARYVLAFLLLFTSTFNLFAQMVPKDLDEQISYYQQKGDSALEIGDYTGAITHYEKVLEVVERMYGKDSPKYVISLDNLAKTYEIIGFYEKAKPLYEEILAITKKALGKNHPDYALALNNLALVNNNLGLIGEVEELYLEALSIQKKLTSDERYEYAATLNNLAEYYRFMNDYNNAEPLYIDALLIVETIALNSELHIAILNNLANLYTAMGYYKKAEPIFLQVLEMRGELFGETHYQYAMTLVSLAELYRVTGDYLSAENLYEHALTIFEETLGEEHIYYLTTLNDLALLYTELGFYIDAEDLFNLVLSLSKEAIGETHPYYAKFLNNMALLCQAKGEYLKSEGLQHEAIKIIKFTLGENSLDYAASLNSLALLCINMGNYSKAEMVLEEALTIEEVIFGENHPTYAMTLNNLALLYINIGEYEKAEPICLKALPIQKELLGENHSNYAMTLNNLALIYYNMGEYQKAEPIYLKALSIQRNILGETHPDYATSLNNLAVLYEKLGDYTQAKSLYENSLNLTKIALGETHPSYALSLFNLALFYDQTQNYPTSYPLFTQALQIYKYQITQNFIGLSEKQREHYYKTMGSNFQHHHSFTLKAHKTIPQTLSDDYNYQLFTKGLQLATAQQMRSRIAASGDTALLADYENWLGQRRFLGKLYEKTIAQRESMGINLDSLEDVANRVEADLARRSEVFAEATDTTSYTWKDVQKQLKAGEAAVEIARFNWYNKNWTDTVYYALMVVTPQTKEHPDVVWLKNGNDLEDRHFKNYTGALKTGENNFDSYLQYWKPLDSLLQGADKVYLSLDGIYHKINLETLITPEGKYLGDIKELHLVGSTKDLVRPRKAVTSSLSALLLGNPAFSADSTELASTAMQFKNPAATDAYLPDNTRSATYHLKALPATQVEIDSIGATLSQKGYTVKTFTGKQAVEEAVKSAESPRILHLATHGAFLEDLTPDKSDNMQFLMGMDMQRATQNPLLRSQLYFNGAQETLAGKYPIDATYDNGILTAYEVVNLNLRGTELVVLSACETGLGEVRNGEGVFGMQRAFQVAGAQSVMMSLWKVSDSATSLFMSTFYRQWLQTGDKRQAFKATQQVLRANPNYKHPYYWGAFVLVGE
jgi:tetratricopeptide (TPR) repeat protein